LKGKREERRKKKKGGHRRYSFNRAHIINKRKERREQGPDIKSTRNLHPAYISDEIKRPPIGTEHRRL